MAVLRRLYAARFPIRRMVPVDAYGASDFRSIEADNTSAFNCRYVDGHLALVGARLRPRHRPQPDREPVRHVERRDLASRQPALPPPGAVSRRNGGRRRRRGACVRCHRLELGRSLVGCEGLPALLGERTLTGALALVAGGALLATGSLRVAALLAPRSTASFLLGAYVLAWAQLIAVLWALSLFGWVSRWALLRRPRGRLRRRSSSTREGGVTSERGSERAEPRFVVRSRIPLCAVLGVAVLAGFGYAVALGLSTPQNDFDTIFDHLWRAALWRENQAVGYPRVRVRAVRQRLPTAWGDGPPRHDGARRRRPLRHTRPGLRLRRARTRCDRGRAGARPLAARGASRGAARRDAARDRPPGVHGAERPRRRVVPRRGRRLPARRRSRDDVARRRRDGACDRDESDCRVRAPDSRRRCAGGRTRPGAVPGSLRW